MFSFFSLIYLRPHLFLSLPSRWRMVCRPVQTHPWSVVYLCQLSLFSHEKLCDITRLAAKDISPGQVFAQPPSSEWVLFSIQTGSSQVNDIARTNVQRKDKLRVRKKADALCISWIRLTELPTQARWKSVVSMVRVRSRHARPKRLCNALFSFGVVQTTVTAEMSMHYLFLCSVPSSINSWNCLLSAKVKSFIIGSASYIVCEVRLVRERDRDRWKWRHLSSAEIGDEFCTFPCQKFAP